MSIFKDFKGMENQKIKFKDFQGPARALFLGYVYYVCVRCV